MEKENTFDTFDSGSGPTIKGDSDYAHKDNGKGGYTSNKADDEQGAVPEVPSVKR